MQGPCRRPKKEKKIYRIPAISKKRAAQIAEKKIVESDSELEKWFEYVATIIRKNPYCWNCGQYIPDMVTKDGHLVPTNKFYRAASAHIFPKAHFNSVKLHPLNFLILGAGCGCHDEFDSSIEKASKMKVWNIAIVRFKSFESQITEGHKYLQLFKDKIT